MQIFEITAKKSIQEAGWFSSASIGALGDKLAAYNAQQAGLSMPNDSAGSGAYGDMRAKAAAAADPLINQMAANEMANWNQTLTNAMKSAGVNTPGSLPPATRRAISNSFMTRVFQYFLEGKLGDNLNDFPEMVDKRSRAEANTLLTKLNSAVRGILNYYSPPTTPEGQFQQWKDLSKATYDMRSLMQFNPAANSQRQQMQVMPPIVIGPGTTGSVKIGRTTLNTTPLHTAVAALIRKIQGSPTAAAPVVSVDRRGDVAMNGMLLSPGDPTQAELIKIIKSEFQKLNP
jgi:hypothetical protein